MNVKGKDNIVGIRRQLCTWSYLVKRPPLGFVTVVRLNYDQWSSGRIARGISDGQCGLDLSKWQSTNTRYRNVATGSRGHNGPKVVKEEGKEVGVLEHGFPRQAAICPSVQPPPRILQAILSSLLQPTIRRSLTLSAGAVECGGNQVQSYLSLTNSGSPSTHFIYRYQLY